MSRLILGILLILVSHSSYAEVYKWVDENGQTRFSDKPPVHNKFETLNMPSSPQLNTTPDVTDSERIEKQKKLLQVFDEERDAKAKMQTERIEKNKKLAAQCTSARNRLEYVSTDVIYRGDGKGGRIYYSDEERAAEIKKIQSFIQRNCH